MPKVDKQAPEHLAAYLYHGVRIAWKENEEQAIGDCPFCSKENRFYVAKSSGAYQCKVCGGGKDGVNGGNIYTFLRILHEASVPTTIDIELEMVAEERKLKPATLKRWGLCQSIVDREWMLPAYGPKGAINNLYRWSKFKQGDGTPKRRLASTKGLKHYLFGTQFLTDVLKPTFLCEGPWDAMALDEATGSVRIQGDRFFRTSDYANSYRQQVDILAVPGCESFKDDFIPTFQGRDIQILFDNDHPKEHKVTKAIIQGGGIRGMKTVANKLKGTAQSVSYIHWGDEGYNPNLPNGYDLRDLLTDKPA